ncbi:MAG TPA: type II secretion system protein N [Paraburkholderia sp.]|jgi:general secretion pathway protein N|nr:type II secretion system protein N [Paraburkholderia sp.]
MNVWMRRIGAALPWLVVALLSSGAVLLTKLPAAWITPYFAKATQGHVNLVEPDGSLWHGSAVLVLAAGGTGADAGTGTLLPGRIEWRTGFWPLFTGRVRMQMRQTEAMPDAVTVDATLRGATMSAGELDVPASLLAGLGAPFNTLNLQGGVRLAWSDWRSFGKDAFGQLAVQLTDMSSSLSRVKPLGSYRVVLQAQGATATIDLSTLKGPLLLNGHGTLGAGATAFQGTASSTPDARDNLAGLLNLLGAPRGPGVVSLDFSH